jgi:hypothetical protein
VGYCRDKTYRLVFDGEFEGLSVRLNTIPIGAYQRIVYLLDYQPLDHDDAVKADIETQRIFCDALIEWNLENKKGEPVPATLDGLRSHDKELIEAMMRAWISAMVDIPAPLPGPSENGPQFPEVSIPMEPLSASQAS